MLGVHEMGAIVVERPQTSRRRIAAHILVQVLLGDRSWDVSEIVVEPAQVHALAPRDQGFGNVFGVMKRQVPRPFGPDHR